MQSDPNDAYDVVSSLSGAEDTVFVASRAQLPLLGISFT